MNKTQFSNYIRQFNFRELFNEMGWNNDFTTQPIAIDSDTYTMQAVAEKSGFKILLCSPGEKGSIPAYNTRKQIETKITKLFHEHLLIFTDAAKTEQIWQFVVRQAGKPTKVTETRWNTNQEAPELLYQRAAGIIFEMDEEEHITIIDVTRRMAENFQQNNERVTRAFYDRFKKEHTEFLQFIKGIEERTNQEWYASLMLNRLMFCYFIQKKGFLDKNKNYLRDKLNESREKHSSNRFYSFYRDFLLVLFHKGLNEPPQQSGETKVDIGRIPYLNGGMFDEHEIEHTHANIDIDDKAFENLFNFFDQYEWHLDTRNTASGKDINPDVIGYIFEKYINDRAAMGAYYTKEDITDYISKNCIIPFLFDNVEKKNQGNQNSFIRITVQTSGDRYIYPAVKKGYTHDWKKRIPAEIAIGIDTSQPNLLERRKLWNTSTLPEFALPTEIWRETIDRMQRCEDITTKIANGEIRSINDFITYNLDIRQFVQDAIENSTDPEFVKHFYRALTGITILDPTCGSGAFLFAAMNILEPLYEACILRMENFTAEASKGKYSFFEEVLTNAVEHPNLQYFIFKSIILRNLYGVDIMKESVEIAKLRLFLKLVATVEPDYHKSNLGLEPLPDIDFNIRCGNTLVGFASLNNAIAAVNAKDKIGQMGLVFKDELDIVNTIRNTADDLARVFRSFKQAQLDDDLSEFKRAKERLQKYQAELNETLNEYLAFTYDIDSNKQKEKYKQWLASHQPFHWFAEFYEIIHDRGGFDVIIGNPPYVEYTDNKFGYKIHQNEYSTYKTRNLYSFVFERSKSLLNYNAQIGMIIQISSISTPAMVEMCKEIQGKSSHNWISNYATRPSYLFDGVCMNLTIIISKLSNRATKPYLFSTKYLRWNPVSRNDLFSNISYIHFLNDSIFFDFSLPKLTGEKELSIISKVLKEKCALNKYLEQTKFKTHQELFYRTAGGRYFKIFSDRDFGSESKSNKSKCLQEQYNVYAIIAILSSNLWWWYYTLHFDMYNCKDYMMYSFPFDYDRCEMISELTDFGKSLVDDIFDNALQKNQEYASTGMRSQLIFKPALSKPIIDEIDRVLASHYDFTEEELDFIINYDIKYRMGNELNEGE
jgi:hypothetical protein